MVNPVLVEKLGIRLKQLKVPVAGSIPVTFVTEPVEMQIAPGMDRPVVLELAQLRKWKPYVNWRRGLLKIWQTNPLGSPENEH